MRRYGQVVVILGMALVASAALAIDPPPSAINRIEFLIPGLSVQLIESCTRASNVNWCSTPQDALSQGGNHIAVSMDVLGNIYGQANVGTSKDCGELGAAEDDAIGRVRPDRTWETVVFVHGACDVGFRVSTQFAKIWSVDLVTGQAILHVISTAFDGVATSDRLIENFRLTGLPTLFDVMTTFEPTGASLSWNVPLRPEAFPASAETFDVLSGDLDTLGDLTAAARIACNVPPSPPTPGERISLVDPQGDPPFGRGRYYVVATQSGGEERIGRQRLDGEVSGRPVLGLPGCP